MKRLLALSILALTLCVLSSGFPILAGEDPPPEEKPAQDPDSPPSGRVQRIRVTATRLPDLPEQASRVPAHVTVFSAEEITASGAATLQDFLMMRSDFVVFDEVGNGVEATADLRGFNTGSLATAAIVAVDGVRVNEPDTGYVNFELVPLNEVDRIELIRGSASALFGEGGLGGVINVVTKKGTDASPLEIRIGGGSFSERDLHAASGGRRGRWTYRGGFTRRLSSGFRENSDTRISSFQGGAELALSERQTIGFDLTAGSNHLNQPGALTQQELEQDRSANPFNSRDFSATDLVLPGIFHRIRLGGGFSLSSRLAYRDTKEDGFNGGRSGLGSTSGITRRGLSATVQAEQVRSFGIRENRLVFGTEWSRDEFDTAQTRTDTDGNPLPTSSFSFADSSAASTRKFSALFLQDTFAFTPRWSAAGGVRLDRVRLESGGRQTSYDFSAFPPVLTEGPTGGDQEFTRVSPRIGFNFNPTDRAAFHAGFSRGFRAPTVIELFAFPIFFSNPDLRPVLSDDYEAGGSVRIGDRTTIALNAFWIDVKDEIFFVLTDPSNFIGINLNLPTTRRRGAVLTVGSRIGDRIFAEIGATATDATFQTAFDDANIGNRVEEGNRLPQIPRIKISARLDFPILQGWRISIQDVYVGSQVLTSDLAGIAPRLDPYNLLNARASFSRGRWGAFLQAANLLDREYSTRGIYAFDFGTFAFDEFYTPAPGRSFQAGWEWKY